MLSISFSLSATLPPKKEKNIRKRQLRQDQVKALEKHFEVENKLKLERKLKIAAELDLEPRQVTIWFQNRRARWKTKQLERDYAVLKLNYDALKLDYDVLEKENASLASKVLKIISIFNLENCVFFHFDCFLITSISKWKIHWQVRELKKELNREGAEMKIQREFEIGNSFDSTNNNNSSLCSILNNNSNAQ